MSPPEGPTIFDTSAVIGLVEGRSPALVEATTDLSRPIMRSATVCGELQHGAAVTGPGQAERAGTLDRYLRLSAWPDPEADLELDELARLYGVVSATSAQPDLGAGVNDRWVIAECLPLGAGLVTAGPASPPRSPTGPGCPSSSHSRSDRARRSSTRRLPTRST